MAERALTFKQEKFCQSVVSGMGISDAYRSAYNCEKMKPATINRNAKTLIDSNKISTRVKEMAAPAVEKAQISAVNVLGIIKDTTDALVNEDQTGNASAIFKGCELLGKHLKLFTDKVEVSGEIGINIVSDEADL